MNGVASSNNKNEKYQYRDTDGEVYQTTASTEELETVGITGNYRYTENMLREEEKLNERLRYDSEFYFY